MSNKQKIISYSLVMPDGTTISFPVFEDESSEMISQITDNWYKNTKDNPNKYNHFDIKERCPICGGQLRAKILNEGCAIWCINHPECNYHTIGNSDKAFELMGEKHCLKFETVEKEGATVVFSKEKANNKKI